jgi:hypothetical protein
MGRDLERATLLEYDASIRYIRCCAPRSLARARDLATEGRLSDLAKHYEQRLEEDPGNIHEPDALHDVPLAARSFVAYVSDRLEEDPALYLACNLFVRVVMAAKPSSPSETEALDIQEHDLECIDRLVCDPRKVTRLREVLRELISLFEKVGEGLPPSP